MTVGQPRGAMGSRPLAFGVLWLALTGSIVLVAHGEVGLRDVPHVAIVATYVGLAMLTVGLLWKHRSSILWASLLGLVAIGLAVAGVLGGILFFTFGWERTYRSDLEVWNRTEAPVNVVGRDATFEVPACGYVAQPDFVVNRWEMHDDQGRFIFVSGGGGGDRPTYIMMSTDPELMTYALVAPPTEPLPPCEGVIKGQ